MRTWLIFFLGALTGFAADFPKLVLPDTCGVNIHFTRGHEKDLDLIAAAGFKFIRMDFSWEVTEQKRGQYDWLDYDELVINLKKRGLRALFILDYSNGIYEPDVDSIHPFTHQSEKRPGSPQHPSSISAYSRWAAAAAKHFRGQKIIWEIYNEPNGLFWKPKADAAQYAALALAASKGIRAADKHATIIAPATSGIPLDFIEPLLKSGVLEFIDGVSVHPYRNEAPETAGTDYKKLREMIECYAPVARKNKIPILSGEWGYTSFTGGVPMETQAAYLVRQQLFNLWSGIPISIWYDWKNDGPDPKEGEHNFGTVTGDLKPKPAYLAMQNLSRELSGFKIVRRLKTERAEDFILLCQNKSRLKKFAAWTTAEAHSVKIEGMNFDLSPALKYFPANPAGKK